MIPRHLKNKQTKHESDTVSQHQPSRFHTISYLKKNIPHEKKNSRTSSLTDDAIQGYRFRYKCIENKNCNPDNTEDRWGIVGALIPCCHPGRLRWAPSLRAYYAAMIRNARWMRDQSAVKNLFDTRPQWLWKGTTQAPFFAPGLTHILRNKYRVCQKNATANFTSLIFHNNNNIQGGRFFSSQIWLAFMVCIKKCSASSGPPISQVNGYLGVICTPSRIVIRWLAEDRTPCSVVTAVSNLFAQ